MAERYIRPEDVSDAFATTILRFLNAAQTAQEIAERVELADELDVGIRVGQRILDRRAQLGTFATLQQVADVPQVGPERFTEIVVTLTGMRPPDPVDEELSRLRDEVRALRAAVAGLGGGAAVRLTLEEVLPRAYLGQVVTLLVEAREAFGDVPVVDLPVTLVATAGEFHTELGASVDRERSIVVRTGIDGRARVRLFPSSREPLLEDHQSALEDALRGIDPAAATPRDAQAALSAIVQRYRSPQAVRLREAIDMLFEEIGAPGLDPVLPQDVLDNWPSFDATVLALAQGAGAVPGSGVNAMAALTLRFRNWIPAWLHLFEGAARSGADVDERLKGLGTDKSAPADLLLTAALGRVRGFVDEERGRVGGHFAKAVADDSMQRFLDEGIGQLPAESRISLLEGLGAARATLNSQGSVGLLALQKGQESVRKTIAPVTAGLRSQVDGTAAALGQLSGQVQTMQRDMGGIQGTIGALDLRIGQFDTRLVDLDRRVTEFDPGRLVDGLLAEMNQRLATFDRRVNEFDAQLKGVDTRVTELNTRVDKGDTLVGEFDGRMTEFDTRVGATDTRLAALDTRVGATDTRLTALDTRVGATDTRLTALDTRVGTVDGRVTTLNTQVAAVDGRVTTLNTQVTAVDGKVTTLNTQVAAVDGRVTTLNTQVTAVDSKVTTLNTQVTAVDGKVTTLNTQLAAVDGKVTTLNTQLAAVDGKVTTLNTQLAAVDGKVTTLNTQVAAVDGKVTTLNTQVAAVDGRVTQLGTRVGTVDTRVAALDGRVGAVDTRLAAVDTRVTAVDTRVTGVAADVTRIDPRIRPR